MPTKGKRKRLPRIRTGYHDKPTVPLTEERKTLAADNFRLAKFLARPFKRSWPEIMDEIDSAAVMGLMDAARLFDPSRGIKFATYARIRIIGSIQDAERKMVLHGYRRGLDPHGVPKFQSLKYDSENSGRIVGRKPEAPAEMWVEEADSVEHGLRKLDDKRKAVYMMSIVDGMDGVQIGKSIGLTKSRVSYLRKDALQILQGIKDLDGRPEANRKRPERKTDSSTKT